MKDKSADETMNIFQYTQLKEEGVMSGNTSPHAQIIEATKGKIQSPILKMPAPQTESSPHYDKSYPLAPQMGIVPPSTVKTDV